SAPRRAPGRRARGAAAAGGAGGGVGTAVGVVTSPTWPGSGPTVRFWFLLVRFWSVLSTGARRGAQDSRVLDVRRGLGAVTRQRHPGNALLLAARGHAHAVRRRGGRGARRVRVGARRAQRPLVGIRRVVAGQLGQLLLGVALVVRLDALAYGVLGDLGEVLDAGATAFVHRGQRQSGDLAGHAPEHGDHPVVGHADVVLPLGPPPAAPEAPGEDPEQHEQENGRADRVPLRALRVLLVGSSALAAVRLHALGRSRPRGGQRRGTGGGGGGVGGGGHPPVPGGGAPDHRLGLDDVLVRRVRDDDGDVVRTTAAQGQRHQALHALRRVTVLPQRLGDRVRADHARQP